MAEQSTVIMADGTTVKRDEPIIPVRTSTKSTVVGIPGGLGVLEILQSIDWPGMWVDNFLMTQAAAILVSGAVTWLVARYSKSPTIPPTVL